MTDWIAETPEQYVQIAIEKSKADLSELRAVLPARLKSTTVGDPVRYTRELEEVYRTLWQQWVTHVASFTPEAA